MATRTVRVYLDHHIPRDNLLYKRKEDLYPPLPEELERWVKIEHLVEEKRSKARLLRKPDFQRATWAWTPDDCVSLIDAVLKQQVIPAVILWLSPEKTWYVLDGGHRISVLMAWIRDDWGDRRTAEEYSDQRLRTVSEEAAKKVRLSLRKAGIAPYAEYMAANDRFSELEQTSRPKDHMGITEYQLALDVRNWESQPVGFPILWVRGDYKKAEESFININKSGRRLSEWETTLVENRTSSFARVVMSIAHVSERQHCWPKDEFAVADDGPSQRNLERILRLVPEIHMVLYEPLYHQPLTSANQPLFAPPSSRPELEPVWLAELLTLTEGSRGRPAAMRKLLTRDSGRPVQELIINGLKILENAKDQLDNICTESNRSLGVVPLVYFYNSQGQYVRSLLFGFMYWMGRGEPSDQLARKRIFTLHREGFENVLLQHKDSLIKRLGRRVGSGSEVTNHTARYFDQLLLLLIQHEDKVDSAGFIEAHDELIDKLADSRQLDEPELESRQRTYAGLNRAAVSTPNFLSNLPICEICGGRFYPGRSTQIDHRVEFAKGGRTVPSNGREVHNFCNIDRENLERITNGTLQVELPKFESDASTPQMVQLFLSFSQFGEDEIVEEIREGDNDPDQYLEDMIDAAGEESGDDPIDDEGDL